MKFHIDTIGALSHHQNSPRRLLVTLRGDDDSSHAIWVDVPGKDVYELTIKQIETLAINKAKDNFSNC
ncbi:MULTISPECIES: hypothetical protein [Klebsiella pneumoniae complex]|uniref:hypothetical protein n=1 Tax=Klebsiella pneumoniae complex TaxID=3390273 RepID=UPI001B8AA619|nr:hypothetical protein [Klebsiella pneumoniae]MBR7277732.1 hypothetical protein [Klebsiella pneumoniae]HCF8278503.1 hypothetical protein [Klebsiella variicola subsp. variicola]